MNVPVKHLIKLNNTFSKLRDYFGDFLEKASKKTEIACWNFYIDSTDENLKIMTKTEDEFNNLYKNENLYKKFKSINKENLKKHELKQLKKIIKDFEEELKYSEELKILRDLESEIAQKYNSYILKIDNKEVSRTEITKILQTEKNPEVREKAYEANLKAADLISEDLIKLAEKRNEFGVKQGYKNYFEYKLKEDYEVDEENLEILINDVYKKSENLIKNKIEEKNKKLREFFKVDKLEKYHYGLLLDEMPENKVNKLLKNKEQILNICKKTYKNMGYDIDNLEKNGKLTLDLFPRKGKNTHGFSFGVEPGNDARILANLTNNTLSIDTLNHELGHSVYTLGLNKNLSYFDKTEYPAVTEAIAMMMGDLQKKENILSEFIPDDILKEFKKTIIEDEVKFLSKALTIINFEKEFYKNPRQNLKKLWHDMRVKYQFADKNEEIDNSWASIPHYLSHPAYYQNYFRADIIKAQIYNHLKKVLGNITENHKTAEYLKENLFKYGISMEEDELIINLTGKNLSVDDFIESITKN